MVLLIIALLLVLAVVIVLFFKLTSKLSRLKRLGAGLLVIFIVIASGSRLSKNNPDFVVGTMHLYHLIVRPDDLYEPISSMDFDFGTAGFSKEFPVKLKYFDLYEIGAKSESTAISSRYKFGGELLVELLCNKKVIVEQNVNSLKYATYKSGSMEEFSSISFTDFGYPFSGWCTDNLTMRIVVVKPDAVLGALLGKIKLYVAVSSYP